MPVAVAEYHSVVVAVAEYHSVVVAVPEYHSVVVPVPVTHSVSFVTGARYVGTAMVCWCRSAVSRCVGAEQVSSKHSLKLKECLEAGLEEVRHWQFNSQRHHLKQS